MFPKLHRPNIFGFKILVCIYELHMYIGRQAHLKIRTGTREEKSFEVLFGLVEEYLEKPSIIYIWPIYVVPQSQNSLFKHQRSHVSDVKVN